jgi:hypothetical protein
MELNSLLPLSLVLSLVSFSLIGRWYVMPWLRSVPQVQALTPLLLLHSFRHLGMAFLLPGVTATALDVRFANPAAYGDLLATLLALLALLALRLRWTLAMPLVRIFNIVGSVDLLNALWQGSQHVSPGDFGAMYFIPAIVVPALLVTHYLIYRLLLFPSSTIVGGLRQS